MSAQQPEQNNHAAPVSYDSLAWARNIAFPYQKPLSMLQSSCFSLRSVKVRVVVQHASSRAQHARATTTGTRNRVTYCSDNTLSYSTFCLTASISDLTASISRIASAYSSLYLSWHQDIRHLISCHAMSSYVISCEGTTRHVTSRQNSCVSCNAMSRHRVTPRYVKSQYHVM